MAIQSRLTPTRDMGSRANPWRFVVRRLLSESSGAERAYAIITAMGHVFVIRGDITRLACDAVIVPCDDDLNVRPIWQTLLPKNLPRSGWDDWLQLPSGGRDGHVVRLPDVDQGRTDQRRVVAVATVPMSNAPTPADVADRVARGIGVASADGIEARGGRSIPLVAVPLAGTGSGGLKHRRGEVIDALLPRLQESADGIDIALVLWDRRDVAAVQQRRTDEDFAGLSSDLRQRADSLGELAGQNRLSLFIGAGVSVPVGLPSWWDLLKDLAKQAGLPDIDWDEAKDPIVEAQPIVDRLGNKFHAAVSKRVTTDKHGIGHALLANLGVHQMVTTNYDACMEHALDLVLGKKYRVLTRSLVSSDIPWLLKLHGDVNRRDSIVLSSKQYEDHAKDYAATRGVVQSLMLTSHLVFVGFGMTDKGFLSLAEAVARVRRDAEAEAGPTLPTAGTVLALAPNPSVDSALAKQLDFICMTDGLPSNSSEEVKNAAKQEGARLLEIFLDRIVWRAERSHNLSAAYLLDDRYDSGLNDADRALKAALKRWESDVPASARESAGWSTVASALSSLGAESEAQR